MIENTNGLFPPVGSGLPPTLLNETPPREYGFDVPSVNDIKLMEQHLLSIKEVLWELREYLKTKIYPPEDQDIFTIVTLYKQGFGGNFIPNKQGRMYTSVYTLQVTNVVITSPLAPATSATIPSGKWVNLNFPDGTSFILDTPAPQNQLNIYVRYTMVTSNNDGPTVP